jgi:hypothetical protein
MRGGQLSVKGKLGEGNFGLYEVAYRERDNQPILGMAEAMDQERKRDSSKEGARRNKRDG